MKNNSLFNKIMEPETPFYYYDLALLRETLNKLRDIQYRYGYDIHYAVKANANSRILQVIKDNDLGADCVSGNEIKKAINNGFDPAGIVYAGVGKSEREIDVALDNDIAFFNCESIPEIEVINERAEMHNKKARIALRINPGVKANTHHYITTGIEENKFGINRSELNQVIRTCKNLDWIDLKGLHFHIGSQITDMDVFKGLCLRINEIQEIFRKENLPITDINVGGGLGIDYENPESYFLPDFESYFNVFHRFLKLLRGQKVHFELGRSIVGQCGKLITRVLYVKEGIHTKFAIVDAGMTELIRPALYQAYHKITNFKDDRPLRKYDVVGPICESSDYFAKNISLPEVQRGDRLIIHSTGAYGEVMRSNYNLREHVMSYYSDDFT